MDYLDAYLEALRGCEAWCRVSAAIEDEAMRRELRERFGLEFTKLASQYKDLRVTVGTASGEAMIRQTRQSMKCCF